MTTTTNIPSIAATIRDIGERSFIELRGDVDQMDAVDVDAIAAAHGFIVVDVIDETTLEIAAV